MPSIADREPPEGLHDALESLERASRTPAKQRAVKVSGVIDAIARHAFEKGLDEGALRAVVQIVSRKTDLDQTSVTTLVKNLYPAQRVPTDVVITVVGALGQGKGKPAPGTQNGLVKWLAIVHEIIDNHNVFSRLYGVLFGMLDMISIRTSLCHLLSLITRRKHVKPFRIQQLLELSRSLGNEPALQGLLRIYKDYYPDIILGSTSTSRSSFPPRADPEWRARLLAIQEGSAAEESTLEAHNGFKVRRKRPNRSKLSAIPDVHTYNANETSVTLEGIDNVEDFVGKLDRLEPPGQLISFLTDPLLQKYVELNPSPITSRRIELWLSTCLEEQYNARREGTEDAQYLSEIVTGLFKHTQYTKTLLPIAQAFLKEYLPIWNGVQDINAILGLLSYIPIRPFEDAHAQYFSSAERVLSAQNAKSYEHLLSFYTDLLRNWMNQATPHESTPAIAAPNQQALHDLAAHISELSTSLLLSLPSSPSPITSSILTFFELLSASSTPHHIPIILPPTSLLYILAQEPSATTFSRISGIVGAYKTAFNAHPNPIKDYYSKDTVDAFNCSIRDFYHLYWLSRALVQSKDEEGKDKSKGLLCDPALREQLNTYVGDVEHEYAIQTAFQFSNNAWLAPLAAVAWRALEEEEIDKQGYDRESMNWHKGPVSQRSLEVLKRTGGVNVDWEAYRVYMLRWLDGRGYSGFKDFMCASSESVKKKYEALDV